MMTELLALDKSARHKDANGFLHVAISHISKATVNPYYGREIPNYEALGLDADKVYNLLRHPDELKKGAATFNNMPITLTHPEKALSADGFQRDKVIGSLGTDSAFDGTYLNNSLVVHDAEAIAGIESGQLKEISCGYRYRADMTPGTYNGMAYDGIMRDITANHVALVERGRAGPDVVVKDHAILIKQNKHKTMSIPNTPKARRAALSAAIDDIKGKLGTDHAAELEYLQTLANDACAKPKQAEDESDEDYEKRLKKLEDGEKAEESKNPTIHKPDKEKPAMDQIAVDAAIAKAREETKAATIATLNAIRQAEKEVAPFVGEVSGLDSAEAVYKLALDAAKVDLADVPASAYRAIVRNLPNPNESKPARIAQDSSASGVFSEIIGTVPPLVRTL
jgi:hypothetical protein